MNTRIQARKEFAALFTHLLDEGSNEKADTGTPWTDQTAAKELLVEPGTIRNWRTAEFLPRAVHMEPIYALFFGERHPPARQRLRELYRDAKKSSDPGAAPALQELDLKPRGGKPELPANTVKSDLVGVATASHKHDLPIPIPIPIPSTVLGPESRKSASHDGIQRFQGRFVRLFLAPRLPYSPELAVHLGDFLIEGVGQHEANVTYRNMEAELRNAGQLERLEFENSAPAGKLKLIGGTALELTLNYGDHVPQAHYLGSRPPHQGYVDWFLMMNLDISYSTGRVAARPMLFVKVGVEDVIPDAPFGPTTELFCVFEKFLAACILHRTEQSELLMLNNGDPPVALYEVRHALSKLNIGIK